MNTYEIDAAPAAVKRSRVRYGVLAMLVIASAVALADRANLSIAGSAMSSELGISSVQLGYLFSVFSWAYVLAQLPAGWLLDRFGAVRVYGCSLGLWSLFTFIQGFADGLPVGLIVAGLFCLRFALGLVESPLSPGNSSIVAGWFPVAERGTATAIYNSAQYLAVLVFLPIMGYLVHYAGWHWVFWGMGVLGLLLTLVWARVVRSPLTHPRVNDAELDYLRDGGANVQMQNGNPSGSKVLTRGVLKMFLTSRQMLGIYVGQYCLASMQYFFLTWFPIYLVKGRGLNIMEVGLVATMPAVAGFIGGVLGGVISDALSRRGYSVSIARKVPFVTGMLLSSTLIFSNFVSSTYVIVGLMTLALFGKGLAAVNFAVVSDTAPARLVGVAGGLFNLFGSVSGIVTPVVIGYAVQSTGSFTIALYFVGAHGLIGAFCYLFVIGKLRPLSEKVRVRE
ncbi:MFS transporter [Pseudomonas typographi]|uniref:MFS transporter n=1 Tax=Pseudomonas typographi TaxID=2715964 RepID=A0ABR7Z1C3_9PSED|nr:MFS transporter [Pseudomonas typographi]MBD1554610.1 MFS transporter [Pseudomonas typographi]MBD1589727.1 MFS transporter [Pseudomonas typographi]MBD1599204.1 MFS transporter [Pseudomonas typographi]